MRIGKLDNDTLNALILSKFAHTRSEVLCYSAGWRGLRGGGHGRAHSCAVYRSYNSGG